MNSQETTQSPDTDLAPTPTAAPTAMQAFEYVELDRIALPAEAKKLGLTVDDLAPLIASIQRDGLLQPPLVTPTADGAYRLIAGTRRCLAAQAAGLANILVAIVSPDTLGTATTFERHLALAEQLNRTDLNEADRIIATLEYVKLRAGFEDHNAIATFLRRMYKGRTLAEEKELEALTIEAFEDIGASWQWFVRGSLPYLSLPLDVQSALRRGDIGNVRTARVFAGVPDEESRSNLIQTATDNGLTYVEIVDLVDAHEASDPVGVRLTETLDLGLDVQDRVPPEVEAAMLALIEAYASGAELPPVHSAGTSNT